ncbi:MAG: hypothetical protein FJ038_08335 [Chloroflexi bacterium]|nr:hypothetical protein [Chloroflexota bacterium]
MEHSTPLAPASPSRVARALPLFWGGAIAAVAIVAIVAAAPLATEGTGGPANAILAAATNPDAPAAPLKDSAGMNGKANGLQAGPGAPGAMEPGGPGRGGRRGHGIGGITITGINGSQLSLRTDNGWTRTIDASDAAVHRGETEIALGDIKVGDQIAFREVRTSDGTTSIIRIQVLDPSVRGTVTEVTGSSVTVRLPDGTTKTIQTTNTTTYELGRDEATRDAALVVGNVLRASGTVSGDAFTATDIHAQPAKIGGEVTATTATSITVTDATGASRTINVSSATTYMIRGDDTPSLGDIDVGDRVVAQGTLKADGSLDATQVAQGRGPGDGGPGLGGRGGHGHGSRGGFDRDGSDDDDAAEPDASPATSS